MHTGWRMERGGREKEREKEREVERERERGGGGKTVKGRTR